MYFQRRERVRAAYLHYLDRSTIKYLRWYTVHETRLQHQGRIEFYFTLTLSTHCTLYRVTSPMKWKRNRSFTALQCRRCITLRSLPSFSTGEVFLCIGSKTFQQMLFLRNHRLQVMTGLLVLLGVHIK